MNSQYHETVQVTRNYYNSDDADHFYATIWGGEDIHIGIYLNGESIFDASRHTVMKMASLLELDEFSHMLDIGSGYGGPARYLAKTFGCHVKCLNLSEKQNKRNQHLNQEQNLDHLVEITPGNFEEMPLPDSTFDVIWSQDAILHSGNRAAVVREAYRVLANGGDFIFTDIMQSTQCSIQVLQPVLDRIHLESLAVCRRGI
ncbi:MAG: class I SAM-dependent methyltransferase [Chloroflexi bacterium]|nr:class I SAM-dependent methyltransferase [Chloroflexota bacterium]